MSGGKPTIEELNRAIALERRELQIDKDVPIPGRGKYPWDDLEEVGNSFFVPGKKGRDLNGPIALAQKRLGIKVTTRNVTENNVPGVRIWRIS